MKKGLLFLFSILIATLLQSQNYQISFSASGVATSIDSIRVKNITKSTTLKLISGDTLNLKAPNSISHFLKNDFSILIYPNPMHDYSIVELSNILSDEVKIEIFDVTGKIIAQEVAKIEQDNVYFEIRGLKPGVYNLNIYNSDFKTSEILVSKSENANNPSITTRYSFANLSSEEKDELLKVKKSIIDMIYVDGDSMRFAGYSGSYSDVIYDVPNSSKNINFVFSTTPTVTTDEVVQTGLSTASSGGNIIDDGGATITARGVCWSTNINPTLDDFYTVNGTGSGRFESDLTGLTIDETYYVKAYATNKSGTSYGNQRTHTQVPTAPVLTTVAASNITIETATTGGEITSDGGAPITQRGVCWDTIPNPTLDNNYTSDGTGDGMFASPLTGLIDNTTYYVRAYAINSADTSYGNQITFDTEKIFVCGDELSYYTYSYKTVLIDTVCWFAENLKTTKYNDGTSIHSPTSGSNPIWENCGNDSLGAYTWYDVHPFLDQATAYINAYGFLYNWYAVANYHPETREPQWNLCPIGWRVPDDNDWAELATFAGSSAGRKLKSERTALGASDEEVGIATDVHPRWNYHATNFGTNETGFDALPAGIRTSNTNATWVGTRGYFWHSNEVSDIQARFFGTFNNYNFVQSNNANKIEGYSIRCRKE